MKLARNISYAMTIVGVAVTLFATIFDLSAVVTLTGMLLIVAGVVKIGMVAIWNAFFAIPVSDAGSPAAHEKREA